MSASIGPPYHSRLFEMYPVAEKVLRLSEIRKGERVVILTDTRKNTDIVDSFWLAALNLGADVHVLMTTPLPAGGDLPRWIVDFLKSSETVLSLMTIEGGWVYQKGHQEILESGVRALMCSDALDALIRLAPDETVIQRVDLSYKMLQDCQTFEVNSEAGTRLRVKRGDMPAHGLNGLLARSKGDFDNFPNSLASFAPVEDSGEGKIVLKQGDVLIQMKHFIKENVTLTIEHGAITKIEGGSDATILEKWLNKFNDRRMFKISHIGWGCEPRAQVSQNLYRPMEWESFYGNLLLAFGSNVTHVLKGKNDAPSHLDIALFGNDVDLDGKAILRKGVFVEQSLA